MSTDELKKDLIAYRIQRLMDKRGLKTNDLVRLSGVGYGTIYRALNGQGNLTMANLHKIAIALGIKPEALTITDEKISRLIIETGELDNGEIDKVLQEIEDMKILKEAKSGREQLKENLNRFLTELPKKKETA